MGPDTISPSAEELWRNYTRFDIDLILQFNKDWVKGELKKVSEH